MIIKQIGTICLILISFFISPTFATEINNPATCDSGTLSTDTGPTNLRANYESNQLNLRYYDNNTLLDVTSTNSDTCTYGTPINLPTAPQKRGYTFKGWKVEQQYDFSTLPTNVTGIEFWSRSPGNRCYHGMTANSPDVVDCESTLNCSNLKQYEWLASFNYGMIYGMAKCTNVSGTEDTVGNPGNETGKYCWCKATGYKPAGQSTLYRPFADMHWVYISSGATSTSECQVFYCTRRCAKHLIRSYPEYKSALFGVSQ